MKPTDPSEGAATGLVVTLDVGSRNFAYCAAVTLRDSSGQAACRLVGWDVVDLVDPNEEGPRKNGGPPMKLLAGRMLARLDGLLAAWAIEARPPKIEIVCEEQVPRAPNNYALAYALWGHYQAAHGGPVTFEGVPACFRFLAPRAKFVLTTPEALAALTPLKGLLANVDQKSKRMKRCAIARVREVRAWAPAWLAVAPSFWEWFDTLRKADDAADVLLELFREIDALRAPPSRKAARGQKRDRASSALDPETEQQPEKKPKAKKPRAKRSVRPQ